MSETGERGEIGEIGETGEMSEREKHFDFVVVGGGIVGLAIARKILIEKLGSLKVIEKEAYLGAHSSGRNSGVLHAGIYYPPGSLKSQLCVKGAAQLREYIIERGLPHQACGKLILSQKPQLDSQIQFLKERAEQNGVRVQIVSPEEIAEIEPLASARAPGLYSPDTWIFDPSGVLKSFGDEIKELGGEVSLREAYLSFDPNTRSLKSSQGTYSCGTLINAAGLWADEVAHQQGVGLDYEILPFRGRYMQLAPLKAVDIRGLIYPVPDLELPFLGLHFTRGLHGEVTVGPTATPAFGRENYKTLKGWRLKDGFNITKLLASFILKGRGNLRSHMLEEIRLHSPFYFAEVARRLAPGIAAEDLNGSEKLGLRPQVVRKSDRSLHKDFVVEKGHHSVHVINAVSPAFSSCLAFADWVVGESLPE